VPLSVVVYVLPAELVVVTVCMLGVPDPEPPAIWVYVDVTVAVLPAESVVVRVLTAPGSVVVLV